MTLFHRIHLALRFHALRYELARTFPRERAADLLASAAITGPCQSAEATLPGFPSGSSSRTFSWYVNVDPCDPDEPSSRHATNAHLELSVNTGTEDCDLWRLAGTLDLVIDGATHATRSFKEAYDGLVWLAAADEIYVRTPQLAFGWKPPR